VWYSEREGERREERQNERKNIGYIDAMNIHSYDPDKELIMHFLTPKPTLMKNV
jgi:hypothetical protein